MGNQWPSSGRIVHLDFPLRGFKCVPAIILDTPDPTDQPVRDIRVQAFPVNEFPEPMEMAGDNGQGAPSWHWPEYVGPVASERG